MIVRILSVAAALVFVGCQTNDPIGFTANKTNGEMQISTGGFGPSVDAVASEEAPAATETAAQPAAAKKGCAEPTALSAAAVGEPCLTTEEFVASLKLPKAQADAALYLINQARQTAH